MVANLMSQGGCGIKKKIFHYPLMSLKGFCQDSSIAPPTTEQNVQSQALRKRKHKTRTPPTWLTSSRAVRKQERSVAATTWLDDSEFDGSSTDSCTSYNYAETLPEHRRLRDVHDNQGTLTHTALNSGWTSKYGLGKLNDNKKQTAIFSALRTNEEEGKSLTGPMKTEEATSLVERGGVPYRRFTKIAPMHSKFRRFLGFVIVLRSENVRPRFLSPISPSSACCSSTWLQFLAFLRS